MYSFKLSDDKEELLQKINNLKLMGWDNSLAYHFSTLDYPFIDYSTMEGHYLDQQRMQKYYLKEKEISRYKEYLNTSEVKGNAPYIASFRDINLTQKTLLEILSFVLGKLYEVESIKVQTPV
ncbi:MAG TPA: hypothetical protein LFW14_00645 [Rickettsia endosymbiont of Degeeriella rufa]|nr:hypothetical protein [Rickettsia endosymbiont of Degeeriella rufa]